MPFPHRLLLLSLSATWACSGNAASDAGAALKDQGVHADAVVVEAGVIDAGVWPDAALPDAQPPLDTDMDGLPDDEDPSPTVPNSILLKDTFESESQWLFSSVSMRIDTAASILRVERIEPFEREGWIGPEPAWGQYLIRSLIRVTGLGDLIGDNAGKLGVLARVNQVTPSRYYSCGLDMKQNRVLLLSHEGTRESFLATAPITVSLGEWVQVNFVLAGNSLACKVRDVEVTAISDLFFSGSVGFRTFDATFDADWIEVYDLP